MFPDKRIFVRERKENGEPIFDRDRFVEIIFTNEENNNE
jgi:hypothetical protein